MSELATETSHGLDSRARSRLTEAIKENQPDLMQVGPVTHPGWDVTQCWAGPLIATSWGFDLLQDIDSDPVLRRKVQGVLERADLLFVDNDASADRARKLGLGTEKVAQFPWGLDSQWFVSREFVPLSDVNNITFLCTRRHEPLYRVGDVVTSFLDAAQKRDNIRLALVGSGSLTGELRAMAAASYVGERIEFLGEIDNFSLPGIYRNADVYITASEVDGTSVSLLEAMASGAVVIASSNEGNAQWVSEETGFAFAVGDTSSLTTLILEMADLSLEVVTDARQRAKKAEASVNARAKWGTTLQKFPDFAKAAISHWGRS